MIIFLRGGALIISFADEEPSDIYNGINSKKARKRPTTVLFENAQMKLDMINRAFKIEDLKIPPNNKLEKLRSDHVGKYSIRINDRYRIIFKWESEKRGASDVEVIDYH